MGKLSSLLWGAAVGAGLMYYLDPQNGNRRKAMVRDRLYRLQHQADNALETGVSDLRHRVRGILAEGMALVSDEPITDQVLEARIRSRLGFLTRHPGAIQVSVENGRTTLSGDILSAEADQLLKGLAKVRGISGFENKLRFHEEAGNIPQLQGEGWLPGDAARGWSPSSRLLGGIGAVYLYTYGMVRGGLIGTLAQMTGFGLGVRSLVNFNVKQLVGKGETGAIRVRKTIQIAAPVEQVYKLWSNFENFPRFMDNIESIKNTSSDRSHWVVKGPAGSKVEFDAVLVDDKPEEMIAWETTPDSTVKHQGQVRFRETAPQNTQVSVNMAYTPPAGVAGAAVAALFGKDPKTEMDADLARMKTLIEEGSTTTKNQTVTRDEVLPLTGKNNRTRGKTGGKADQPTDGGPADEDNDRTGPDHSTDQTPEG